MRRWHGCYIGGAFLRISPLFPPPGTYTPIQPLSSARAPLLFQNHFAMSRDQDLFDELEPLSVQTDFPITCAICRRFPPLEDDSVNSHVEGYTSVANSCPSCAGADKVILKLTYGGCRRFGEGLFKTSIIFLALLQLGSLLWPILLDSGYFNAFNCRLRTDVASSPSSQPSSFGGMGSWCNIASQELPGSNGDSEFSNRTAWDDERVKSEGDNVFILTAEMMPERLALGEKVAIVNILRRLEELKQAKGELTPGEKEAMEKILRSLDELKRPAPSPRARPRRLNLLDRIDYFRGWKGLWR